MAKRSILVMLLFTATAANAQVGGAGGAPSDIPAQAAPRRAPTLSLKRADASPRPKAKATQRPNGSGQAAPGSGPQPTKPRAQPPAGGR
jgi:hypothetical protein